MKTSIITLLCVIAITACTNTPKNSENIGEAQLKEAQTVAQNFLDNLAKNDTTAIMATFSGNPEFTAVMDGGIYKRADMIPIARTMLGGISKQTFENITDKCLILSPTVFIYDYKCLNRMYEKSGVVTTIDPICGSYTFQKEQEGWKIIHMHETWMNMKVDSSMVKK
jgi:hypothetical protein